jgi:5-deoxy-D-glucuronate isomerase
MSQSPQIGRKATPAMVPGGALIMSRSIRTVLAAAAAVVSLACAAAPALADTPWQAHHPRREQVNNRLAKQNARIHQQVKEGELSRRQAARLHGADRRIRAQERRMAARNGGYITRRQQLKINREENHVSRHIGR